MLAKNRSSALGYNVVINFQPLEPSLNYTRLLELGYATSELPGNKTVYSYTIRLSSSYKMGSLNYLTEN